MNTTTSLNDNDASRKTETKFTSSVLAESSTNNDFPQGCQFSPDGLCVLTSRCNRLELYNTQTTPSSSTAAASKDNNDSHSNSNSPWSPVLTCCQGGDTIRSYTWYPHMNSADPSTCCFAGVSRDQPVHLYDAYTGAIRATYRPYNTIDEMESPTVVDFVDNGARLAMGGFRTDRMIHLFDLNRPGRDSAAIFKLGKTRRSKDGQKGLVSALASSSSLNVLAVGTYSPGSIYIYDLRAQPTEVAEIVVTGITVVGHGKAHSSRKRKHFVNNVDDDDDSNNRLDFSAAKAKWYQGRTRGGVTQLEFSYDCQSLYSLSRRGNAVLKWDIRKLSSSNFCPGIDTYATINDTNQRISFALSSGATDDNNDEQQLLWVGGQDNCVRVYNQNKKSTDDDKPIAKLQFGGVGGIRGEERVVNGVSVTKLGSQTLLATSAGSRRFPTEDDWDQDDPHLNCKTKEGGMLQLMDVKLNHTCLESED